MIYIVLDSLPPSSNQAYFNHPAGGRALTKAATAYKKEVTNFIVKHHAHETLQLEKNAALGCYIFYGFPEIFNKGWPKKAKTRYKHVDLENRPKLLLDAIVEATSMDDSQIFFDSKMKYHSEKPQTHVYIWNEEKEQIGSQLLEFFKSFIGRAQSL
jgi:Holliday junction resolvase RusA-like endonuclease